MSGNLQLVETPPPPVNYEAEQALLAAMLANNNIVDHVCEIVEPEHFAELVHGRIYGVILDVTAQDERASAITLGGFFANDPALAEVGGAEYLARLESNYIGCRIKDAINYASLIRDCWLRREIITLCQDSITAARDPDVEMTGPKQVEAIEGALAGMMDGKGKASEAKSVGDLAHEVLEDIEAARKSGRGITGLSCGFADLDRKLGGLQRSDLIVIAGRPSMGKTALASNIGYRAALAGARVGFFSLEMSARQLVHRLVAERASIAANKLRAGQISDDDFEAVSREVARLRDVSIVFDDEPHVSGETLRSRARRIKRRGGLDLLIVDYLQLMHSDRRNRNDGRWQEVTEITRALKAVAKELDIPVIALSQLSRQVEQREDKRPVLSDLRESGSIEQDADVVAFVYREFYYLLRDEPKERVDRPDPGFNDRYERWTNRVHATRNLMSVIVAKQRSGPIGEVKLRYQDDIMRVDDLQSGQHQQPEQAPIGEGDLPF